MATKLQRHLLRDGIVDRLQDILGPDIQVSGFFPGELTSYESVWCNGITGELEFEFMMAGRKARWDVFELQWMFTAGLAGQSISEASERVVEMFDQFETLIIENTNGVLFEAKVCDVLLSNVDGPNVWMSDMGHVAILEATVTARSYLT